MLHTHLNGGVLDASLTIPFSRRVLLEKEPFLDSLGNLFTLICATLPGLHTWNGCRIEAASNSYPFQAARVRHSV